MLIDLVENTTEFIEYIIISLGPLGIVLIAFLENMFPPTPPKVLYPLTGKLAYDGQISVLPVVAAGTVGYQLGDTRIQTAIARYGKLRTYPFTITIVTAGEYNRAMPLYERRGGIIVFAGRLTPFVHGVVSIPTGVARMNLGALLFYTALGAAAWIDRTIKLARLLVGRQLGASAPLARYLRN